MWPFNKGEKAPEAAPEENVDATETVKEQDDSADDVEVSGLSSGDTQGEVGETMANEEDPTE